MNEPIKDDRRIFARFVSTAPIKYKNLETGLTGEVFARNIGGGGLRLFSTGKSMEPNDTLELWIKSPNTQEYINIKGKVIWSKEVGQEAWDVGVSFSRVKLLNLSKVCEPPAS